MKKASKGSSTFRTRVEAAVRSIPKGETRTYGEVAQAAGYPRAARAVGTALANNRDKTVPCHRVIRADGCLGGYNSISGSSKEELLRKEGAIQER